MQIFSTAALRPFHEVRDGLEWERWADLARDAAPYLAPRFFELARPFVGDARSFVAEAWDGDELTGALPLVLDDHHTLRGLRSDHSPGFDYCGTMDGIAAIWRCLRDDVRWSELVLDRVPADSLLATELPQLARADGCPVVVRADPAHPYFPLADFEAAMKPKFLTNLKRCARKAEGLVFERVIAPTAEDLHEAEALEAMAWKAAAGTDIASDPRAAALYEQVASLAFVRIGGKRVAVLFTIEDEHTLYALKIGYDPAYAHLSPGHLVVWKVATDAEARGLGELDFVGREDGWKHKWTEHVHRRSAITIYRRSARGLVRYGLREVVKPHLPEMVQATPRSPFPRGCQRADHVGTHPLARRLHARLSDGFDLRGKLRRAIARELRVPPPVVIGEASAFPVGSYVRVQGIDALRATLDEHDKLRGLYFTPAQWRACDRLFRVTKHVRRLRDDRGRYRAVSRTVLLEGVDCGYGGDEPTGCGRHCPLMFRDEWLVRVAAPATPIDRARVKGHARVRALDEIYAGLDAWGRRDGLTFMPEMAALAKSRFAIAGKLDRVWEYDRWIEPAAPIYLLDGLHCTGAVCKTDGPCDRACALLWHADWLVVEEDPR